MKKFYILVVTLLVTAMSFGQVFITELADPQDETTCRFVELYNAGATAVDLSTGYKLQRYTNGGSSPQDAVALTGTIAAGGFYIVGRAGFNGCYGFDPDQSLAGGLVSDSNGDDQIQLLDAADAVLDLFGVPGEDGNGTCHEFLDGRAERIASITTGNAGTWSEENWNTWTASTATVTCTSRTGSTALTVANSDFDPGAWIGAPVTDTLVSFSAAASSIIEDGGTIDVCVSITNPDASNATTVDVNLNAASTAINGTDYASVSFPVSLTFAAGSDTEQCFTITITDDSIVEIDETIQLDLENVAGGNSAVAGTGIAHTVTIAFNDVVAPNPGDIVITEIMQDTSAVGDGDGEYFEVYNTTASPIDMFAWELTDPNSSTVLNNNVMPAITNSTIVPANGYLVFSSNGDTTVNGGVTAQYDFDGSGTGLFNGAGSITLTANGTLIDTVEWDGGTEFPDGAGVSMELSVNHYTSTDNDTGANWCSGTTAYGAGDLGTPGASNDCTVAGASVSSNTIEGFSLYPNPTTGVLNITTLSNKTKIVEMFTIIGKKVLSNSYESSNFKIDATKLNTGLYILKVTEGNNTSIQKVVLK